MNGEIPLRLGPLHAGGATIRRSGVRWLCASGDTCAAGQIVAYFSISVRHDGPRNGAASPFADEHELYVACAPRVRGRIRFDPAPGGYLSMLGHNPWDAESTFAWLAPADQSALTDDATTFRLLMHAGRRMAALADVQSGLLASWYGRSRAWWSEGERPLTVLALGICDVTGVVTGERRAFFELFAAEPDATQIVFVPDQPLAPAAPVLLDQLERTPSDARAIAEDIGRALARGTATADDYLFAGTLVATMQRNPMRETHDLLLPTELATSGPADAVFLSLSAEPPVVLRHKKLGYRLDILQHNQHALGPALATWLSHAFEPVARTIDDVKADYERLFDAMERTTGALPIVLNRMSTSGDETLSNYAPFDAPLGATLANVEAKELNLMLSDLAATRRMAIVDVDAIAAAVGGARHLPDGIHQSGELQALLRGELSHALEPLRTQRARVPTSPRTPRP